MSQGIEDMLHLVRQGNTGIRRILMTILHSSQNAGSELTGLRACIAGMAGYMLTRPVDEELFVFEKCF